MVFLLPRPPRNTCDKSVSSCRRLRRALSTNDGTLTPPELDQSVLVRSGKSLTLSSNLARFSPIPFSWIILSWLVNIFDLSIVTDVRYFCLARLRDCGVSCCTTTLMDLPYLHYISPLCTWCREMLHLIQVSIHVSFPWLQRYCIFLPFLHDSGFAVELLCFLSVIEGEYRGNETEWSQN